MLFVLPEPENFCRFIIEYILQIVLTSFHNKIFVKIFIVENYRAKILR